MTYLLSQRFKFAFVVLCSLILSPANCHLSDEDKNYEIFHRLETTLISDHNNLFELADRNLQAFRSIYLLRPSNLHSLLPAEWNWATSAGHNLCSSHQSAFSLGIFHILSCQNSSFSTNQGDSALLLKWIRGYPAQYGVLDLNLHSLPQPATSRLSPPLTLNEKQPDHRRLLSLIQNHLHIEYPHLPILSIDSACLTITTFENGEKIYFIDHTFDNVTSDLRLSFFEPHPRAEPLQKSQFVVRWKSTTNGNYETHLTSYAAQPHSLTTVAHFVVSQEPVREEKNSLSGIVSVRVETYNLWNFNNGPNWTTRRKYQIAHLLSKLNADYIGFQEVRQNISDNSTNMLGDLARLVPGYNFYYHTAMVYPDQGVEEGLGVFVRHTIPISSFTVKNLTRDSSCSDLNTRILIDANTSFNLNEFHFTVTHWSYDSNCQITNAIECWDYVKTHSMGTLVGDFNLYSEDAPAGQFLVGRASLSGQRGNLTDVWKSLYPAEPGYTFSSWNPVNRADRIYTLPNTQIATAAQILGKASSQQTAPSDHMTVAADCDIL